MICYDLLLFWAEGKPCSEPKSGLPGPQFHDAKTRAFPFQPRSCSASQQYPAMKEESDVSYGANQTTIQTIIRPGHCLIPLSRYM